MLARLLVVLAVAVVAIGLALSPLQVSWGVPSAAAERIIHWTEQGYRCEINFEQTLAKGVCRHPSSPGDFWYVVYFEKAPHAVFVDRLWGETGVFESETLPLSEWPH
jgi:hypothetical protein